MSIIPQSADSAQRDRFLSEWGTVAPVNLDNAISAHPELKEIAGILNAVFGNSPYLSKLLLQHPDILESIRTDGADTAWAALIKELNSARDQERVPDDRTIMSLLRRTKARAALHIALCDIAGIWELDQVTGSLSDIADSAVTLACYHLIRKAVEKGDLNDNDIKPTLDGYGLFVLALGKLGARELNYSSDIDLMVLFDKEVVPYTGSKSVQEFAVKFTRDLVKFLDERTADGYVFRTDLRLRPDPGSTAIAVSTEAAEIYYESWGQNWERSALIKARAVGGDKNAAERFLSTLDPFIWRKSLDFYAIQDIHSIKRQIHAHKGGSVVQVLGHNIKIGKGGIREIEFFVQIQQLIWGGRIPDLRCARTLEGLQALVSHELVDAGVARDLQDAYIYLRNLEHRLQMLNDEQTQTLPEDPEKARKLAIFYGYPDLESFTGDLTSKLKCVESHYADLFEDAPELTVDGNLVFTGTEDDPGTLDTLKRLGYENPTAISAIIRGWHAGRYRATRSTRSRQILTELIPALVSAFGRTAQPDKAFLKFDQCLQGLPSGVQVFSIFYANPDVLDLVAEIMGDAPRLANYLSTTPQRLDYVLDPDFYGDIPPLEELKQDIRAQLSACQDFESKLDKARLWANDMRFRIGVQVLRGMHDPLEGGRYLTDIAEAVLAALVSEVEAEYANQYGTVRGSQLGIVAYGKLGSREMMPTSDLDIVIVYDAEPDANSEGTDKPLPASAYYIRLAQRIISALTVMTPEGRLYDVDLRLRPSGDQGPLACTLQAFEKYQRESAWSWEHIALTRARIVYGNDSLRFSLEQIVQNSLSIERDETETAKAICNMRNRLRKEFGIRELWDIKRTPGGLLDTELIVQYCQLISLCKGKVEHRTNTLESIAGMAAANSLSKADSVLLSDAICLWSRLLWLLRLATDDGTNTAETFSDGLRSKLVKATNADEFSYLETKMKTTAESITEAFDRLVEARNIS